MGRGFEPHGAYKFLRIKSGVFFPILTERLNLSPLGPNDLEGFVTYRQDPEVARYQSWEPTYSKAQALELIDSQQGQDFPGTDQWLQIGIRLHGTDELVGDLALHAMQQPDEFELGFSLSTSHQGQGYAREAARALLEQLFSKRQAKLVLAFTDSRNLASKKLLGSLGFLNQPDKNWVEEFKGETVTVETYELRSPSAL